MSKRVGRDQGAGVPQPVNRLENPPNDKKVTEPNKTGGRVDLNAISEPLLLKAGPINLSSLTETQLAQIQEDAFQETRSSIQEPYTGLVRVCTNGTFIGAAKSMSPGNLRDYLGSLAKVEEEFARRQLFFTKNGDEAILNKSNNEAERALFANGLIRHSYYKTTVNETEFTSPGQRPSARSTREFITRSGSLKGRYGILVESDLNPIALSGLKIPIHYYLLEKGEDADHYPRHVSNLGGNVCVDLVWLNQRSKFLNTLATKWKANLGDKLPEGFSFKVTPALLKYWITANAYNQDLSSCRESLLDVHTNIEAAKAATKAFCEVYTSTPASSIVLQSGVRHLYKGRMLIPHQAVVTGGQYLEQQLTNTPATQLDEPTLEEHAKQIQIKNESYSATLEVEAALQALVHSKNPALILFDLLSGIVIPETKLTDDLPAQDGWHNIIQSNPAENIFSSSAKVTLCKWLTEELLPQRSLAGISWQELFEEGDHSSLISSAKDFNKQWTEDSKALPEEAEPEITKATRPRWSLAGLLNPLAGLGKAKPVEKSQELLSVKDSLTKLRRAWYKFFDANISTSDSFAKFIANPSLIRDAAKKILDKNFLPYEQRKIQDLEDLGTTWQEDYLKNVAYTSDDK